MLSQAAGGTSVLGADRISTSSPLLSSDISGIGIAVDLRRRRHCITDVGMDGIGEIDHRRAAAARAINRPFRGEAENLVVEQLQLGVLQEFVGTVAFRQQPPECAATSDRPRSQW